MKNIPPFDLIPKALNESAKKISASINDSEIGKRHKLGGKPDFIKNIINPICPECKEKMTFYAQLDSINDEYMIADKGMIYVFYCFECSDVKAVVQSE